MLHITRQGTSTSARQTDVTRAHSAKRANDGDGYRAVYGLADPERSVFIQSTGQSGNPLSGHYADYAEDWRDGRYLPMLTDRTRIEEDALGTLVLSPRYRGGGGVVP